MRTKLPIEEKLLDSLLEEGRKKSHQEILSIGALVRLFRLGLGITQRQLAKRAQVPQSTIIRIESGESRPKEMTIRKIFNALECDIAFIPIPRFKDVETLLREKAKKIAEKRLQYIEGTMALEQQRPDKLWQRRLLESEIELILKSPSQLWDENVP